MEERQGEIDDLIARIEQMAKAGLAQAAYDELANVQVGEYDSVSLCRLGRVAAKIGGSADAELYFRAAINLSPNEAIGYECLGTLFLDHGDLDQAVQFLSESIQIEPNARRFTFL